MTFRCQACSRNGPCKIARLIRRRYPYTAGGVAYAAAAITALWFPYTRKAGELMLGLLAIAVVTVIAEHVRRP